ncbi:MAG: CHRD domain-containing protein [Betaproteobacteria bacterium]
MNTTFRNNRLIAAFALAGAMGFLASCQSMGPVTSETITLLGANEVPPVMTTASGSGTVTIKKDGAVSVHIMVSGMTATAAHIHEGAAGANGPVIVPFTKTADNVFDAPAGAKLTDAQMASLKAGKLYVNVHSAKNPGGEVRAQLKGN